MKCSVRTLAATGVVVLLTAVAVITMLPSAAAASGRKQESTTTTEESTSTPQASTSTTVGSTSSANAPSNPACTPSVFAQAQQLVQTELTGRIVQLQQLSSEVANTANYLTPSDRQALENDIDGFELPGIEALKTQTEQATTCAQLRDDAHSMVFTYRVYLVMTPQTHLTIVADNETDIENLLSSLEPTINSAIEKAQTNGANVSGSEVAFKELKTLVAAAQDETSGLSAQLLAQTPAGSPGNWQVFLQARTNLTTAHNDLHSAYADALQVKADLS